jgi:hypothetical protein
MELYTTVTHACISKNKKKSNECLSLCYLCHKILHIHAKKTAAEMASVMLNDYTNEICKSCVLTPQLVSRHYTTISKQARASKKSTMTVQHMRTMHV